MNCSKCLKSITRPAAFTPPPICFACWSAALRKLAQGAKKQHQRPKREKRR